MATGGTSTGSVSFGGLASGLDTKSIVEKLVEVKKQQLITPLQNRIDELTDQKQLLSPIKKAFNSLLSQARRLNDPINNSFNLKTGVSSDTSAVLVTSVTSNKAVAGNYIISNLSQLAQADRVIFNGIEDLDQELETGTFDITYKGSTTSIEIDGDNNTLEGIVSAINSSGVGVIASIINDGSATPYRLALTARDTGADTTITHTIDSVITSLSVDAVASAAAPNQPANAAFDLNGIATTSASNTVTGAIQGVTFALIDTETDNNIAITVSQDTTSTITRITDFLTAYNEVRINLQAALLPDANGQLGPLGSDSTLTAANVKIASIMGTQFRTLINDTFTNMAKVGIKVDTSGLLKVDSGVLKASLESDAENVQRLFQGNSQEDGIAERMKNYVDSLLNPTGTFAKKENSMNSTVKGLQKQMISRQETIDDYEASLNRRYGRLEQLLSQLKTQEAAVASFAGIYSNSNNQLL